MADALLAHLPQGERLLRLVFFGGAADEGQYAEHCRILYDRVGKRCGDSVPAWSYVAQSPLNAGLSMEVHSYEMEADDRIVYANDGGIFYVVLENGDGRFLFAGGCRGDIAGADVLSQAQETFGKMERLLRKTDFPWNSIVRQWNYLERITDFDGVCQRYQLFNNVRSEFYGRTVWENGYPAATGIGTVAGGVMVDWDAAVFNRPECRTMPIDNQLQIAAHAYSERVLAMALQGKATPKFERAKSMTFDDRSLVYVSGTAAIRGEKSLADADVESQFRLAWENMMQLTSGIPFRMLRVYLKKEAYYEKVRRLVEECQCDVPVLFVLADVCREELLIEMEGIAV